MSGIYKKLKMHIELSLKRLIYSFYKYRYTTDNKLILFEAYRGERFAGNPKALYLELLHNEEYQDYHFLWAFIYPENFKYIEKNPRTVVISRQYKDYFPAYAKAGYWVNNVTVPNHIYPKSDQTYIETWHGTPLKRLGCDITVESDPRQSLALMKKRYQEKGDKFSFLISPSAYYSEKMISAFGLKEQSKAHIVIETGYPRNDALLTANSHIISNIKKRLNISENVTVILYTPTWRDSKFKKDSKFIHDIPLDLKKLQKELGDNYLILFRAHQQVNIQSTMNSNSRVIDVTAVDDINDLFLISDMLITDYSSTMFDYANLKRPMVFYMYDLEEYEHEIRGFYFDISTLPGPIVQSSDVLADTIKNTFQHFSFDKKYQQFNDTYNYLDDGYAATRVWHHCLKSNQPMGDESEDSGRGSIRICRGRKKKVVDRK